MSLFTFSHSMMVSEKVSAYHLSNLLRAVKRQANLNYNIFSLSQAISLKLMGLVKTFN